MYLSGFSERPYEQLASPVLMLSVLSLCLFFSQELVYMWNSRQGLCFSEQWLAGTRPSLLGKTRVLTRVAVAMHSKPEISWKPWALQVLTAWFAQSIVLIIPQNTGFTCLNCLTVVVLYHMYKVEMLESMELYSDTAAFEHTSKHGGK